MRMRTTVNEPTPDVPDEARQHFEYHIPNPVQGVRCTFCTERALGYADAIMTHAGQSWRMTLSLCREHKHILAMAGDRGRVHGPTRIRYRLLE